MADRYCEPVGCNKRLPHSTLMCPKHWKMVSYMDQQKLLKAKRNGGENGKDFLMLWDPILQTIADMERDGG